MNNKFDELAKGLARSVTRRQAFKRFGLAICGALTASLGLEKTSAAPGQKGVCEVTPTLLAGGDKAYVYTGRCINPTICSGDFSSNCPQDQKARFVQLACGIFLNNKGCSF
jgi:hypothetical protein